MRKVNEFDQFGNPTAYHYGKPTGLENNVETRAQWIEETLLTERISSSHNQWVLGTFQTEENIRNSQIPPLAKD